MMIVVRISACLAKLFLFSQFHVCPTWPLLDSCTETAVAAVQVPVGITFVTNTVECPQLRSTKNHVVIGFLGSAICHSIYSPTTLEQGCIHLFTHGFGFKGMSVPFGAVIWDENLSICAFQHYLSIFAWLGLGYLGVLRS